MHPNGPESITQSGGSLPRDMRTRDLAEQFGCSDWKVRQLARQLSVGIDLGGRAGFRFTPADVEKIRRALAPKPAIEKARTA